jgi:branched-chain amino acid transport system permease protein
MLNFKSTRPHYYLALGALTIVTAVFVAIQRSAFGYRLRAIRENIAAAEVIGVDSARTKILAATISAALIAALGTLYAQLTFFFDPDTVFGLAPISIRVALIAILGGAGVAIGPIIGSLVIIPLEEGANFAFASQAAGLSGLIYGLLLITVILIEPRGLVALAGLRKRRRTPS